MRARLLVWGALLLCASVGPIAASEYYVCPSGDDAGPGTLDRPWRTIAKANEVLKPGDTVYLRAGSYAETIRPERSGVAGEYITYTRYGNEEVTVTGAVRHAADLGERSHIVLDGLRFIVGVVDGSGRGSWVEMAPASTHNIIRNCYMSESGAWAGVSMGGGANYNQILNNTFIGNEGEPVNGGDLIQLIDADYNVIEGNDFEYAGHIALSLHTRPGRTADHNVIRNNTIRNPWHTGLRIASGVCNLVENNLIVDCGSEYLSSPNVGHRAELGHYESADPYHWLHHNPGIQLSSRYSIIRRNRVDRCSSIAMGSWKGLGAGTCQGNRIYHNTLTNNHYGVEIGGDGFTSDNIIQNNLIAWCSEASVKWYMSNDYQEANFVRNDIWRKSMRLLGSFVRAPRAPLEQLVWKLPEGKFPGVFVENLCVDPAAVPSLLSDAGAFLTRTISAGSGKVVAVADASFFYDGFGIPGEVGDEVQFEDQTERARIVAVDYEKNLVTLDHAMTWTEGLGFGLAYKGSAPDIGAEEDARPLRPDWRKPLAPGR